MGNNSSHPSNHSRSHSFGDDMLKTQQRHHAKSDEIPYYNYPSKQKNGNYLANDNNQNGNYSRKQNGTRSKSKPPTKRIKPKSSLYLTANDSDPNYDKSRSSRSSKNSNTSRNSRNTTAAFGRSVSESTTKTLIMEGWLTKLGESSKKLKKRYWKLYDNGKLSYNTKQTGSFKKYADLKIGIDKMSLKDDKGFQVEVAQRVLIFYAETTKERDAWFGIIFSHHYSKGRKDLKLLQKSSDRERQKDHYNNEHIMVGNIHENEDQFDEHKHMEEKKEKEKEKKSKNKWRNKKNKKRRTSFDSTKFGQNGHVKPNGYNNPNGAVYPHQKNGKNGKKTKPRSQSRGYVTYKKQDNKMDNDTINESEMEDAHNHTIESQSQQSQSKSKSHAKEDGMIIFSEQYMNQQCDGKTCLSLERVHYVLKKYDLWRSSEKKIMSLGMYKYINNGLGEYYNNTHLLNDFNHLIEFHDNVFNHIFEYFDGECHLESCLLIKRLHRDRNYYKNDEKRKQIYYNYDDPKEINTQQILDKIHCYYRHSYDLGFRVKKSKLLSIQKNARTHARIHTKSRNSRLSSIALMNKNNNNNLNEESKEATHIIFNNDTLTDNEEESFDHHRNRHKTKHKSRRRTIGSSYRQNSRRPTSDISDVDTDIDDNDNDDDIHGFEDEWKLLELCGLIQQKRASLRDLRGVQRINTNKFISTVGKSYRYHYWNKYDDDDDSNWLIQQKYNDFKQELLSNNLYTISLKQWEYLYEKANNHFEMKRSKKIRPHKYWAELYDLPRDSVSTSFSITRQHLISMMLYCNYDILQRRFAETFFKLTDNETDDEIKKRHTNFYHFGRLLRELIECFGKKIYNKNIVFYHGITDEMMFIETTMYFHCPLSTTTSIEVAIAYSNNNDNDYLLELQDDDTVLGMARYFDCCWLSDFGNEYEKFFIGGYKPLKIHTVLDAVLGRNYCNYLKALHIIDEMFQGYYFDTDSDEIKQIILHLLQTQISLHKKKMSKPTALNNELLKEIRQLNKKPTLYMGVLSDDTEEEYNKQTSTQVSIDKIVFDIDMNQDDEKSINDSRRRISRKISSTFTQSRLSTIDMEEYDYFNETPKYITKLVDYYCMNVINVCIDYKNMNQSDHKFGFKFCKKLLCIDKYEWIKLPVFLTLFPNLKEINVRNITLSEKTIKNIYDFLHKITCNNQYKSLYRIEIFEVDQNKYSIADCIQTWLDKFKDLRWTITFNPFEDEMCILKL